MLRYADDRNDGWASFPAVRRVRRRQRALRLRPSAPPSRIVEVRKRLSSQVVAIADLLAVRVEHDPIGSLLKRAASEAGDRYGFEPHGRAGRYFWRFGAEDAP